VQRGVRSKIPTGSIPVTRSNLIFARLFSY
jgi:hypothetical protein